ncbi:MAG: PqqD family protein [Desulforhopalus sp.]
MDIKKSVSLTPGFVLEKIDNEITVYHPSLTASVYMNESGAAIWELCDGKRSISEIITILCEAYPESSYQIEDDVIVTIRRLVDHDVASLSD